MNKTLIKELSKIKTPEQLQEVYNFGKDDKIRKEYNKYVKEFYEEQYGQNTRDERDDT